MGLANIKELLRPEKHLSGISKVVIDGENFLPKGMARPRAKDYPLYLKQKDAIQRAEELHLVELVPNLVHYIDYPRDIDAVLIKRPLLSTSGIWREQRPALKALYFIGKSAVPALNTMVRNKKLDFGLRFNALWALKMIDAQSATKVGQDFEKELNSPTSTAPKELVAKLGWLLR